VLPLNCPYLVTFDLDLDLEHTLDEDTPGDHCVRLRSMWLTRQMDGWMDRQMDASRWYIAHSEE